MKRGNLTIEQRLRQTISRLTNENAKLRARIVVLEQENLDLRRKLETVLLRMNELEVIIFGKKKKKNESDKDKNNDAGAKPTRSGSSYIRPTPSENDITETLEYNIDNCPDCGTPLTKKQIITRYIEDIRLACLDGLDINELNTQQRAKQVIEQRIAKGYCPKCKSWYTAIPVSSKITRAGSKVRMFVAYAINILRLSYEQTRSILVDLHGFQISDGEIAHILAKTASTLNPEVERLKKRILESVSVHFDETGHRTGREKNYSWVMASGDTEEAVFLIGKSRGKGNADDLGGEYQGVRITDCYAAYKNMNGEHQVCWAHIIRKARDLKDNGKLEKLKREFAGTVFAGLKSIYGKIVSAKENSLKKTKILELISELKEELDSITEQIFSSKLSVKKLLDLGKLIQTYKNQLFTCLKYSNVDATNNKAERKLRHLVLKRKTSFGTKTPKGDKTLEINLSVLLSLWWQDRKNFFPRLNQLLAA